MTVKRADIEAGWVDFTDVATGRHLPVVHPGQYLRDEILKPLSISVYALAQAIKVPRTRLNDIVLGRRAVSPDTALRLARYFGMSAAYWLNLQSRHDLDVAQRASRRRIEREVSPRAA
jgi:addiction module HigA family antidote